MTTEEGYQHNIKEFGYKPNEPEVLTAITISQELFPPLATTIRKMIDRDGMEYEVLSHLPITSLGGKAQCRTPIW